MLGRRPVRDTPASRAPTALGPAAPASGRRAHCSILVLLLGQGYAPKIAIAALISFFPTLVNMVRGLESVDKQALELMHVLSASKVETFFKLRLISSLPYLFAALKIATGASVVGAVVAEWIGSNLGLGVLV